MRILRWNTLLGRRLAGEPITPWMLSGVVAGCVLLSLAGTIWDLSTDHAAWVASTAQRLAVAPEAVEVFAHGLCVWTAALMALGVGIFALAHCTSRRTPEALILASTLPIAALVELLHAGSWFSAQTAGSDQLRLWCWLLSRLAVAVPLLAGALAAVLAFDSARLARRVVAASLGSGGLVLALALVDPATVPALAGRDGVLVRPWDLVPLALFAFAGLFVFSQLHRLKPSVMSHALILAAIPQCFAQIEASLSLHPKDGHAVIAHLDVLIAYGVLLVGALFDYIYTRKSHEDAVNGFESAQLELRSKTQELVRVDRELVDQDIKRRRAERTLRILEKAVETMSLGVTVTDLDGRILYANPADARMHGWDVDDLLGKNASLYSAAGQPPTENSDSVFLHPWARERTNVTRDGRIFPVRLVSDMVYGDDRSPIALVTLCEDISERKRIEAALERRDRILEAVGLAAERFLAEPSWEASVEEVLESLKQATRVDKVRLVRVEDLKPHAFDDTWSVLDNSRDTAPVAIELPLGDVFPRWGKELRRGRLLQGRVRDLPEVERRELTARGIRSFAVVPIFVLDDWLGYLSLEDSDEEREWSPAELEVLRTAARTFGAAMHRKQAEAALAASQAKYQDLLENANDLVQSVSPEGRFQFVNRSWRKALGYDQDEISRLTLWDVVHSEHHRHFAKVLGKIFRGGHVERVEVVFVAKNGREIYLEGSLNARFVAGEPVATRGIFRDITERQIVDRMKKEFISTVSHELRTPLTSIIASLGLLHSGRLADDAGRTAELIAVAHRNGNRLLQLINDLLDLQKLAAGKIVYRFQAIDVAALLEESLGGIQSFADSLAIEIRLGEMPEGLQVRADRDRLMQVLNNLLSNAIKFSPHGDHVTVEARRAGDTVVISVADHGPGIPEEFRSRLFERFTQVDSSATRSAGGSGLGLSIVKGLVEGMNGRVSLDTEIGRGTVFHLELPVPAAAETADQGAEILAS